MTPSRLSPQTRHCWCQTIASTYVRISSCVWVRACLLTRCGGGGSHKQASRVPLVVPFPVLTQWSTLASGDSDPAFDLVAVFVEDADKFEPKSLGPLQIPVVVFGETSVSFPEYEGSALESMVPHGRYSPTTLDNFRHL